MKRCHGAISQTPAALLKHRKTSQLDAGPLGTPVEGLTGTPVDTPDSDDRPGRPIPETTQRRLEGFCLNTPLSLSQAQDAETPTLGGKEPAAATQQQQQHAGDQLLPASQQQQHAHHVLGAAPPASHARHRLANISNLPQATPVSAAGGLRKLQRGGDGRDGGGNTSSGPQPMQTGGTTARPKRRHVMFQADVVSPPASQCRAAAAAAAAAAGGVERTPCMPGSSLARAAAAAATPASCGNPLLGTPSSCGGDDDLGFVLHTSQTYVRHSQPAISPNVAAGLSAADPEDEEDEEEAEEEDEEEEDVEEPFTTPSQDSREPRASPSNATSLATTTVTTSFELPHALAAAAAAGAAAAAAGAAATAAAAAATAANRRRQPPQAAQPLQQLSQVPAGAAAAAAGGGGGITLGDGLLLGGHGLEETTTPELEQIGCLASQEPGGSQQQLSGPVGAAAAAATAAAAGTGPGNSAQATAAAAAAGGVSRSGRNASSSGRGGSSGVRGAGVVCEEVTTKQVLFPIFRPKSQRKCVILVRHGESTYNKQDTHGRSWADPSIFDAPLTSRGRQQAIAARDRVREQLDKHTHLGATLWLSSPLSRALETMLLAAPQVEALAAAAGGGRAGSQPDHRVVVLSMIAEHCATSGDVGRPASELATQFPGLASALGDLPEEWWFNPAPEDSPNCTVRKVFNKVESVELMRRRVSEFSRWLHARPEQLVVAFGHSTFWKYFANSRQRLRNCEVLQMWW